MPDRIPLYYTFGNHMHWVDMEWLWGYHVIPGSVRDMIQLCREAGVKGCVNFEGIGYEKLASEDPAAFAELREAIQSGLIEVVGGSYGQPYGLFHGGESNVRQRIYGARTVRRLFGVPVKTFWEEEFDFFPQLPQILRGVGMEYASLFFQWTWHTPEVPVEDVPVVWWEGQDGSRLLCATRNKLNLHQWPEDMELTFAALADNPLPNTQYPIPLVLQWLELMPSPDWMCRSELILPKLQELLNDPRFEVKPVTLGEYLGGMGDVHATPARRYTMDQVWHGMTLGKNGDNMRRLSREAEASLLSAEALAAVAGLFGRPYAQWDVYPTWELEEAWRELLSAQHHDNDECEGLCGHVGRFSYQRSLSLSGHAKDKTIRAIDARISRKSGSHVNYNPLGWERMSPFGVRVPAYGYVVQEHGGYKQSLEVQGDLARYRRSDLEVEIDLRGPRVQLLASPDVKFEGAIGQLVYVSGGQEHRFDGLDIEMKEENGALWLKQQDDQENALQTIFDICQEHKGLELEFRSWSWPQPPDPGLNSALQARFGLPFPNTRVVADTPFAAYEVSPRKEGLKKYPTGDWMTSPQWFEKVHDSFTSFSFVDLIDPDSGCGLLILHDGSQQWLMREGEVRCILTAKDPWDESYWVEDFDCLFRIIPHGPLANSSRWKLAQELRSRCEIGSSWSKPIVGDLPASFCPVACEAPNVALTAFYRETRDSAKGQSSYASDALGVDYPYVLRMVELDGIETEATLTFGATVGSAVRTNLLGEPDPHPLAPSPTSRCDSAETGEGGSRLTVSMRPYEIATIYLDLVEGRKQIRDLDAKREVWATVHRVD